MQSHRKQIEVSKVEGDEVLRQFEAECREKEATLLQLEDATEANQKLTARIEALEKEKEEREKRDERDREER